MANRCPLQRVKEGSNLDQCRQNGRWRKEGIGLTEMKASRSPGSEQGRERTQRSLNATQILSLCE